MCPAVCGCLLILASFQVLMNNNPITNIMFPETPERPVLLQFHQNVQFSLAIQKVLQHAQLV